MTGRGSTLSTSTLEEGMEVKLRSVVSIVTDSVLVPCTLEVSSNARRQPSTPEVQVAEGGDRNSSALVCATTNTGCWVPWMLWISTLWSAVFELGRL